MLLAPNLAAAEGAAAEKPGILPAFVIGNWTGEGYQISGSKWTIALVAQGATAGVTISYASLNCGGTWTLIGGNPHLAWFRETITYGKKSCVDGGKIAVTPIESGYLTFSYFSAEGKLLAWSTLARAK